MQKGGKTGFMKWGRSVRKRYEKEGRWGERGLARFLKFEKEKKKGGGRKKSTGIGGFLYKKLQKKG